jgi:hypothetical protein
MVVVLSREDLQAFNQRQSDLIKSVKQLQSQEMQLYGELEANVAANGDTAARDLLVVKIDQLSNARMDMYRDLMDNYAVIRDSVGQTRGDLVDQLTLIDIVQQQLDSLRRQTSSLNAETSGKQRMIEINTYYGKKYMAQKELMQLIILTCVPLLVLALLAKFGTLGNQIASILGSVVLVVGLYYIVRKVIDISTRSNMNFDEYDWAFDPAELHPTVIEYDLEQLGAVSGSLTGTLGCVGQQCCSAGTTYDQNTLRCVASASATRT